MNNKCVNSNINLYELLGVNKGASKDDINKSFKKLAVRYHPDKCSDPDAKEKFQQILKAKEILSDPEKKEKYDKHGIIDDADEHRVQEQMMQELMLKEKLKEVIRLNIDIQDVINGFSKTLNLDRDIIDSIKQQKRTEKIEIKLVIDSTVPLNKPIMFKSMGKKYDDIFGDLFILLNIVPNKTFKVNKSNFNLITKQKISIAQSLCGFTMSIPYKKNNPIIIKYDNIIKPNSMYEIKGIGLKILDSNDQLVDSNIEVHFEIQYDLLQKNDTISKLKKAFNYKDTETNTNDSDSDKKNIYKLEEVQTESEEEHYEMFENIFSSNGPQMNSGSMRGGFPFQGMGGTRGGFPFQGMEGIGGNQQECHVQ